MKQRLAVLIIGALLAVSVASNAAADSSTCQTYSPQTCTTVSTTGSVTTSSLPFTGLDVGLLLAGGAGLLGTGLVLRTLSRRIN